MKKQAKKVIGIGAILLDELYFCDQIVQLQTSNPAQKSVSLGGVVANIAQHLALLDVEVSLLTAFGQDADALFVQQQLDVLCISYQESVTAPAQTGKYVSPLLLYITWDDITAWLAKNAPDTAKPAPESAKPTSP